MGRVCSSPAQDFRSLMPRGELRARPPLRVNSPSSLPTRLDFRSTTSRYRRSMKRCERRSATTVSGTFQRELPRYGMGRSDIHREIDHVVPDLHCEHLRLVSNAVRHQRDQRREPSRPSYATSKITTAYSHFSQVHSPARPYVDHRVNGILFSLPDFASATATPHPWYQAFIDDLDNRPVIFIGSQLQEPMLYHYLELRKRKRSRRSRRFARSLSW